MKCPDTQMNEYIETIGLYFTASFIFIFHQDFLNVY